MGYLYVNTVPVNRLRAIATHIAYRGEMKEDFQFTVSSGEIGLDSAALEAIALLPMGEIFNPTELVTIYCDSAQLAKDWELASAGDFGFCVDPERWKNVMKSFQPIRVRLIFETHSPVLAVHRADLKDFVERVNAVLCGIKSRVRA